jgi:hypothetical protein
MSPDRWCSNEPDVITKLMSGSFLSSVKQTASAACAHGT